MRVAFVRKPATRPTFSAAVSSPIRPRSWWTNRRPRRRASAADPKGRGSPATSTPPPRGRQVNPGQDLDQRRFAGTVLADERVNRTAVDVERHIRKRPLPGEGLRQVLDRHQRRSWLGHRGVSTGTVSTSTVSTDAAPAAYADLALARSGYHPLFLAAPAVLVRAVPA